jgi:hypothetical protein
VFAGGGLIGLVVRFCGRGDLSLKVAVVVIAIAGGGLGITVMASVQLN